VSAQVPPGYAQGETPYPLLRRGTPRLGGAGSHPAGNRGAPARGVDVKPSLGQGPGRPQGAEKPLKSPKSGFFGQNGQNSPFSAKMAFLAISDPFLDPAGRGFTSTPRRARRGPGPGLPGALLASRTPSGVPGDLREPSRAPPGGWGPRPGPPRQGFYINPSRQPPAVPGGARRGPLPESREPLPGSPGATPAPYRGENTERRVRGGLARRAVWVKVRSCHRGVEFALLFEYFENPRIVSHSP